MAENLTDLSKHYPWLNSEFFGKILEKENPTDKIAVENVHIKPALKHGENYASQMIRATVKYVKNYNTAENNEIRFVIKALAMNEAMAKMTKEYKIFDREIIVYQHIMPEVVKLLESIGDNTKLSPKCYATSIDECYLVFEDLVDRNYKNTDRRNGLDVNHYELVLSKLAKWHAATAKLYSEKNIPHQNVFENSFYDENSTDMNRFVTNCIDSVARLCETIPGYDKRLAPKLAKLSKTAFSKMCKLSKPDGTSFIALTHGDLWANNIMYTYEDIEDNSLPRDALMVDFQGGLVGPVVMDLAYTLFSSSHASLTDVDWDRLLQHYHMELRTTLSKLNYSLHIPTLTEIHTQFLTKAIINAPISIMLVGVRQFENADENSTAHFIGESEEDAEYRFNMLANPKGQKNNIFLFDYFDRKGLLEVE